MPITSHQNAIAASGSAELTWMCPAVTPRPPPGGCAMAERAVRKQTARKSMAVSNVINSRIEAGYRTIFRFSGVTSHNAICTALVALGEAGFPRRAPLSGGRCCYRYSRITLHNGTVGPFLE